MVAEVRAALEETPPGLVADIMVYGIMLAGGRCATARPRPPDCGRDQDARHIATDPRRVARGAGMTVENIHNQVYREDPDKHPARSQGEVPVLSFEL